MVESIEREVKGCQAYGEVQARWGGGNLFITYEEIFNELHDYAHSRVFTPFRRLKSGKYYDLRRKYSESPSHYIYTVCRMAYSI